MAGAASSPSRSAPARSATCTVTTPPTSASRATVFDELFASGRVTHHPVFPSKHGPAARRIASEDDVREVIELMRLNYDRVAST